MVRKDRVRGGLGRAEPIGGGQTAIGQVAVDVVGADHIRTDPLEDRLQRTDRRGIVQAEVRSPTVGDLRSNGMDHDPVDGRDGGRHVRGCGDMNLVAAIPQAAGQEPRHPAGAAPSWRDLVAQQQNSHPLIAFPRPPVYEFSIRRSTFTGVSACKRSTTATLTRFAQCAPLPFPTVGGGAR